MNDTISRQQAIDVFYSYPNINWTTLDVLKKINEIPTIQFEIVRCGECEYYHKRICPIERYFSLDGFCSRGKRRGDDMITEKIIDILKGIKDGTACLMPNMPEDGEKAIDIAIKAVEHPEPHWHPVSEQPQEEDDYLLLTYEKFKHGTFKRIIIGAWNSATKEWLEEYGDMYRAVNHPVAWMSKEELLLLKGYEVTE